MNTAKVISLAGAALVLLFSTLACCCGVPQIVQEGIRGNWPSWTFVPGSGKVVSEERTETGFSGIALRGIGHLHLEQGETESVEIEAESNLLPYLETRVEGSMLIVEARSGAHLWPTRPIVIRVTVDELDRLEISGSVDAEGDGLRVDDLALIVSGSGDLNLTELEADAIRIRISGSGIVALSGSAQTQDLTINGSGRFRGGDLRTLEADVQISGSGSALINASDRLDATISGSGSVRYVGTPAIQSTVNGSGSIRQTGD